MFEKVMKVAMIVALGYLFIELYRAEQQMAEIDRLMLKLECVKPQKK